MLKESSINFTDRLSAWSSLLPPLHPAPIPVLSDVDQDGDVTALGDGLMIIRKLFGPAFAGDKLTNKAIVLMRYARQRRSTISFKMGSMLVIRCDHDKTPRLGDRLMIIIILCPAFVYAARL